MTYNQLSKEDINKKLSDKKLEVCDDYSNTKTLCTFKCLLCGKTFMNTYDCVRYWKGSGCLECKSNSNLYKNKDVRIKHRLDNLNKNKSDYIEIINTNEDVTKITCKCLICNEIYTVSYETVKNGSAHRKCAMKLAGYKKLMPKEMVDEKVKSYNNDILIDFSNYFSADDLLDCHCNVCHHNWKAKQKNLIRGRGCPKCAIKKRKDCKTIPLSTSIKVLNDFNLDLISEYINASTPLKVKCRKCGHVFSTSIVSLSNNKTGCVECNKKDRSNQLCKIFLDKMNSINEHIQLLDNFTLMSSVNTFICNDCGKTFKRTPHDFLKSPNCPNCTTNSKLEYYVLLYLNDKNIKYELHKNFEGLIGVNNGDLSYDFYLSDLNILLECQGKQHFAPVEYFGGEQQFIIQQEHDKRKRDYANSNNIRLIEIPYWEENNINNFLNNIFNNIKKSA